MLDFCYIILFLQHDRCRGDAGHDYPSGVPDVTPLFFLWEFILLMLYFFVLRLVSPSLVFICNLFYLVLYILYVESLYYVSACS